MSFYREDDYLLLSGIQHFAFCRRQWALIHIEQLWEENVCTVEGNIVHDKCHDEDFREKRGDLLILRALRIVSARLGLVGQCDTVEFTRTKGDGVTLHGEEWRWLPCPIEYKRGVPKEGLEDKLQLCAQGVCLEEMFCTQINKGYIFYNEIHRREEIEFTPDLRAKVAKYAKEMHEYFRAGKTPQVKPKKQCHSCSLKDLCLPRLAKIPSVAEYYRKYCEGT